MNDDIYNPLDPQENYDLPDLPTRPILWRRYLGLVIVGLLVILLLYFALDTLLGSVEPDPTPPQAVLCDDLQADQVVFQLDPAQSEARYEADEKLFGERGFNSPIGRTNSLAGYIVIDFENPAASRVCEMVVNVSQLTSDLPERDRVLRSRFLQTDLYPNAYFEPTKMVNFPANPQLGAVLRFEIHGDLKVKNITAPMEWAVELSLSEDRLEGSAEGVILLSSYGIGPIRLAGITETADDVSLQLDFVALRMD